MESLPSEPRGSEESHESGATDGVFDDGSEDDQENEVPYQVPQIRRVMKEKTHGGALERRCGRDEASGEGVDDAPELGGVDGQNGHGQEEGYRDTAHIGVDVVSLQYIPCQPFVWRSNTVEGRFVGARA